MVMKPEPLVEAIEALAGPKGRTERRASCCCRRRASASSRRPRRARGREALVLVCGRYEGVDQRVIELAVDEELSIGDYVLSGGEVPAMVLIEGVTRLLPGVLGNPDSARFESFQQGLLEGPQYTRPAYFAADRSGDAALGGSRGGRALAGGTGPRYDALAAARSLGRGRRAWRLGSRRRRHMNRIDAVDPGAPRKDLPPFRPGDTVRVHVSITEGDKQRIQVFEGVVIRRRGRGASATFTVRKISYGVGVERIFLAEAPSVTKVEIKAAATCAARGSTTCATCAARRRACARSCAISRGWSPRRVRAPRPKPTSPRCSRRRPRAKRRKPRRAPKRSMRLGA